MNIDTLNAYCGPWLVYCPCLAQGRFDIHPGILSRHWAFAIPFADGVALRLRAWGRRLPLLTLGRNPGSAGFPCLERRSGNLNFQPPATYLFRPESRQDYPPNLSILISGGKENNCDALSNGE